MTSPGLLTELKEAVTALMVITIMASVYGGVKSKEIEGALSVAFVFTSVFTIALWATAMLGLSLASAANTIVLYIAVIWAGIVIVLLIFMLGITVSAIIAFNEVSALRSLVADMWIWSRSKVVPSVLIAMIGGTMDALIEEIRRLLTIAFIYSAVTAAYGLYLVFLAR